jgi:hypothetical protein
MLKNLISYHNNFKKLKIKPNKDTKNKSRTNNKKNNKPMLRIAPRARDQKG